MAKAISIFGLIIFLLVSCSKSDEPEFTDSACDEIAILDNNKFRNGNTENYSVENVTINGDCLEVEIVSGGCSGENWEVTLVDAERIAESLPEQRDIKILLENNEACLAIVRKEFSFDLRPLRTTNNEVLLNLENWDERILYEY